MNDDERRVCIKISFMELVLEILTVAFGKSTLSQKGVHKLYKSFTEGYVDDDDDECPGVATTSKQ